jgi:tRNA threonylcarbamoyladenosine biosynthesis protein TsaE
LLVEWPERGAGVLPAADLEIHIDYAGEGRMVTLKAATGAGRRLLAGLDS